MNKIDLRNTKKIIYNDDNINKIYVGSTLVYELEEGPSIIYRIRQGAYGPNTWPKGVTVEKSSTLGNVTKMEVGEGNINFAYKSDIISIEKLKHKQTSSCNQLFYNCNLLESINLTHFDTSEVDNFSYTFSQCTTLKNLITTNLNTTHVTNFSSCFYGCETLEKLNLNSFNTSNATNIANMFKFCYSLKELKISNFDTRKVKTFFGVFVGVPSTCKIYVGNNWTLSEQQTGFTGKFIRV